MYTIKSTIMPNFVYKLKAKKLTEAIIEIRDMYINEGVDFYGFNLFDNKKKSVSIESLLCVDEVCNQRRMMRLSSRAA